MKRQIATSLSVIALIGNIQPTANAGILDLFASFSSALGDAAQRAVAPRANTSLLEEVSVQQFSTSTPQLDPNIQSSWSIIVFGSALAEDGSLPPQAMTRARKTLEIAQNNPQAGIIVTGGKPQAGITEAQAMRNWLVSQGVAAERVTMEEASTDTASNARNATALIDARGNTRGVIVVTSADHIRRATLNFRLASGDRYDVIAVPADSEVAPPVPEWEKTLMEQDLQAY